MLVDCREKYFVANSPVDTSPILHYIIDGREQSMATQTPFNNTNHSNNPYNQR